MVRKQQQISRMVIFLTSQAVIMALVKTMCLLWFPMFGISGY